MPHLSITGDRRTDRALRAFGPKIAKKILRKVLRKAAKPVLETAKANVRVDTGNLRKSLKVRALKRSRKRKHTLGVRVVTGEQFFKGDAFYGGFIEFGFKDVPAMPFLRPAHDENKRTVPKVFMTELRPLIKQTAREVR